MSDYIKYGKSSMIFWVKSGNPNVWLHTSTCCWAHAVAECLSAGGEVGVIPVKTGYPVSGNNWQDVKDKEYRYLTTNAAHF